ncbi:MAG: nucleotidyltransferase domain-containing protein [Planctomycetes bacterium]|nr:nucleotidyltransferase domain-containing protein [Planctomycetota bacterium]
MAAKPRPKNKTGGELFYRYLPPNIPMAAIRRFARRIAEKFDPEKIILFGSFAYGTPREGSDVDLLVVMEAYNEINQSIRISLAFDPVFPLDLIVITPQRLKRRLADGFSFWVEITSKGITLYEKRNARRASRERQRPEDGSLPGQDLRSLTLPARRAQGSLNTHCDETARGTASSTECAGPTRGSSG